MLTASRLRAQNEAPDGRPTMPAQEEVTPVLKKPELTRKHWTAVVRVPTGTIVSEDGHHHSSRIAQSLSHAMHHHSDESRHGDRSRAAAPAAASAVAPTHSDKKAHLLRLGNSLSAHLHLPHLHHREASIRRVEGLEERVEVSILDRDTAGRRGEVCLELTGGHDFLAQLEKQLQKLNDPDEQFDSKLFLDEERTKLKVVQLPENSPELHHRAFRFRMMCLHKAAPLLLDESTRPTETAPHHLSETGLFHVIVAFYRIPAVVFLLRFVLHLSLIGIYVVCIFSLPTALQLQQMTREEPPTIPDMMGGEMVLFIIALSNSVDSIHVWVRKFHRKLAADWCAPCIRTTAAHEVHLTSSHVP